MSLEKIKILSMIIKCLLSGMVFAVFLYMGQRINPGTMVLRAYENVCMRAKNSNKNIFNYERWEDYLRAHGATYYFGTWMNPVTYLGICLGTGFCGMIIGGSNGILPGIVFCGLGICMPAILLQYLDKKDNEKMLADLDMVYSALSIQIQAGVYFTDALAECYGSVQHRRLNEGLKNLSGDIVMKADLGSALERFQKGFSNRYIDSLCITIMQATESGQAVDLLGDIAEQIKDMEITLQHKKKEQLNRSTTFYQLGIFALILVLVLYACAVHLFSASLFSA